MCTTRLNARRHTRRLNGRCLRAFRSGASRLAAALVLGVGLSLAAVVHADDASFALRIVVADNDWGDLNEAEQRALAAHRHQWRQYSPEQRARLRGGAQRFMTLSPAEREEVIRGRERYRSLPPEQRQHLREEYRREHGKGHGNGHGRDRD